MNPSSSPRRSLARPVSVGVAVGVAVGLLAGCQKSGTDIDFRHNRTGTGTPIAKFNSDSITVEELELRALELSPFQRTRLQTQEGKKEMVEGLARYELVVSEAVKRGLHNDPVVVAALKQAMVDKLLRDEVQNIAAPITDAELAAEYEKHKSDYVKPEMVRMVHLFIEAPRSDAAKVAEAKKKIDGLLTQARAIAPMDFKAFGELVRANSEEKRTQPLDGDLRYLSREELAEQYGAEVAEASSRLTNVGEVSDAVQTEQGFHILKLQGRQAALNLGIELVKTQLIKEITSSRRSAAYAKLLEGLEKSSGYAVDDTALAKANIDMSTAAKRDENLPSAGFLPPPNRAASLMNGLPGPPPPGTKPALPGAGKAPPPPPMAPVLGGPGSKPAANPHAGHGH